MDMVSTTSLLHLMEIFTKGTTKEVSDKVKENTIGKILLLSTKETMLIIKKRGMVL